MSGDPLARATARGAAWSAATFLVAKGLGFAATLVLARLLAPEDFGLIALALVVMGYLDLLNDLGINAGVIWSRDDLERTSDVAFGLSVVVGAALTLATLVLAPVIAAAYGEPEVAPILVALSVTFLVSSLGSVQNARLRRALAFRRRFAAEVAKAAVKLVVTVTLAASDHGVWSLVYGQIAGVGTGALAYWRLAGWRPGIVVDRALAGRLLRYGSQLTVVGLLGAAVLSVDYIVIGRRQGPSELGYYTIAFRLPELLVLSSCSVLGQVLFPAFAEVARQAGDRAAVAEALLRAARVMAALTVPLGVGVALLAPELVAALFGSSWMPAVVPMRWLALYAVLVTLLYLDGDAYKAIGRPGLLNAVVLGHLVVAMAVLWWAAGAGIEVVAAAQVVVAAVILSVRLAVAQRVLGLRAVQVARMLQPVAVATLGLVVAVVAARAATSAAPVGIRLAASAAAGAVAYGAGLWMFARPWVLEVVGLLVSGRRRRDSLAPMPAPARRRTRPLVAAATSLEADETPAASAP